MTKRKDVESAIEELRYHAGSGNSLPSEAIKIIVQCFDEYLSAQGTISLDEAFFGGPHKKRASYAFKKASDWRYRFFYLHRKRMEQLGLPKLSLERLAELHMNADNEGDTDVDAFLRGYYRWKSQQEIED